MKDNWSLKNKEIYAQNIIGREITTRKEYWITYSKEDIEILRQKIIEDIVNEIYGFYPFDDSVEETKEIVSKWINKRFGVE